jgi:hypothetical protein
MLTTLNFQFLYHKPQLCSYFTHIMTHLHLANDFWNLNILKLYFEFQKKSTTTILKLWMFFICASWMVVCHHFNFFPSKFLYLKSPWPSADFGVLTFKSPSLKSKFNSWLFKFLQHSYKSFSTDFLDPCDL